MRPVIAIQSKDTDKILEVVADYYRQFNLELAELAIGNQQSRYMTLGKHYEDWQVFSKATNYGSTFMLNDVTTFFDVLENVTNSEEWTIIEYRGYGARYGLDADDKLAQKLSENLNIITLNFYKSEEYHSIVSFNNGRLMDELTFEYNAIYAAKGFFQKYDQLKQKYEHLREQLNPNNNKDLDTFEQMIDNGYKEMKAAINDYLDNLKLDLFSLHETIEIDYDKQCRRFLLKGDPISLQKYLKIEKMGTLDLDPLKGL